MVPKEKAFEAYAEKSVKVEAAVSKVLVERVM